mmetsp:Transcript_8334/g.14563  ORF Transcript_8334/g.14563 Transcript_8334/m.14563 type:complete len:225 (+) Transcript_8334:349-1023(+)
MGSHVPAGTPDMGCTKGSTCKLVLGGCCKAHLPSKSKQLSNESRKGCGLTSWAAATAAALLHLFSFEGVVVAPGTLKPEAAEGASGSANSSCDHCIKSEKAMSVEVGEEGSVVLPNEDIEDDFEMSALLIGLFPSVAASIACNAAGDDGHFSSALRGTFRRPTIRPTVSRSSTEGFGQATKYTSSPSINRCCQSTSENSCTPLVTRRIGVRSALSSSSASTATQ